MCQVCRAHFNLLNRFSARSLIFLLLFNVLKNKTKIDLVLLETLDHENLPLIKHGTQGLVEYKSCSQSREKQREENGIRDLDVERDL